MEAFYFNTVISLGQQVDITDSNEINHAFSSLRISSGDTVELINGKGGRYGCKVIECSKKSFRLLPVSKIDNEADYNDIQLTIAVSMLNKSSKMKLLIEKLTEIGIAEFIPFISKRTSFPKMTTDSLRSSMISALKQCGGSRDVEIKGTLTFDDLIKLKGYNEKFFSDINGKRDLKSKLSGKILAVIGPEGGFTEYELEVFTDNNFKGIKLNRRILRAETAAIVTASKFLS